MNGPKRLSEARRGRVGALGWAGIWSLMLSVGLAFAGDDEVYTWKDAAGRVHYGNHPPEGQAAEPVQLAARRRRSLQGAFSNRRLPR